MGFSSQGGHVAFMTQPTPGTFAPSFNTLAIAMKLKSGSLGTNRDLLTPDPEIGGGRDVVDSYLGAVVWSGDYEFYARFNALLTLLYAGLGIKQVKAPGGTSSVWTLTPGGTITGGTWTITYSAQTTTALAFDADANTISAALQALSSINQYGVIVTGGPISTGAVVITFIGAMIGTTTALTVTAASLTGSSPTLTPTNTTPGTAYTGANVHTFFPSDAASLQFLSIQERIGAGFECFNYTDGVVNTLHFESEANGYLMGKAGMIARQQLAGATPMVPDSFFDNLPMVVGTNITVLKNGVALSAKKFSFDLTNNFEQNDYRLGSFFVGDLTPKRREASITFGIREVDSTIWRQASYGTSGATAPGGVTTKDKLVVTMATYEVIPGATPTLNYTMKMTFPTAILVPYSLKAQGDDVLESDITYNAVRPGRSTPLMYVEVITPKATVI